MKKLSKASVTVGTYLGGEQVTSYKLAELMSVEHEELSEQLTARNEGVNILSKVSPPLCVKDGLPVKSNIKGQGYQMPISTAITFMADYYNER